MIIGFFPDSFQTTIPFSYPSWIHGLEPLSYSLFLALIASLSFREVREFVQQNCTNKKNLIIWISLTRVHSRQESLSPGRTPFRSSTALDLRVQVGPLISFPFHSLEINSHVLYRFLEGMKMNFNHSDGNVKGMTNKHILY